MFIKYENIVTNIERLWSANDVPERVSFVTYDDEGTYNCFYGTRFDEHLLNELLKHSSSLTFFTDSAFRYYLASYLIAIIKHGLKCDVIIYSIESHLSAPKGDINRKSYANRVGKLTLEQRQCVLDVLETASKSGLLSPSSSAILSFRELCK